MSDAADADDMDASELRLEKEPLAPWISCNAHLCLEVQGEQYWGTLGPMLRFSSYDYSKNLVLTILQVGFLLPHLHVSTGTVLRTDVQEN